MPLKRGLSYMRGLTTLQDTYDPSPDDILVNIVISADHESLVTSIMPVSKLPDCLFCRDAKWVCEEHPDPRAQKPLALHTELFQGEWLSVVLFRNRTFRLADAGRAAP
jgi:hypothetical protein